MVKRQSAQMGLTMRRVRSLPRWLSSSREDWRKRLDLRRGGSFRRVARCVIVEPSGRAQVTRVHVRFGQGGSLDHAPGMGLTVPGAEVALDAARQYLAASGCRSIDGLQAEVLVEGVFRPIRGESLALAVFVAAVSARLQMPLPAEWAFTGAIGTPSVDQPGPVMPVNEIVAKLSACGAGGCSHLMVPSGLLPDSARGRAGGPCELEAATTTAEAIERVLPEHRLPEVPRAAGWAESIRCFLRLRRERHASGRRRG